MTLRYLIWKCGNSKYIDGFIHDFISLSLFFFVNFQADDNASGIHFTAGRRLSRNRLGSTNSIQSTVGSVPRVNTVTNVFKRFFSRDDSRSPNTMDGTITNFFTKEIIIRMHLSTGFFPIAFCTNRLTTYASAGSIDK